MGERRERKELLEGEISSDKEQSEDATTAHICQKYF